MGKGRRRHLVAAWGVVAAIAAIYAADLVRGPTREQRVAAERLRMPPQPPGRNAWPALWSADYDVSPDAAERFYADDLKRLPAWLLTAKSPQPPDTDWPHFDRAVEHAATPLIPFTDAEREALCGVSDENCLDKVRSQRVVVKAVLERHARRLARVEELAAFDQLWSTAPANALTPIPLAGSVTMLWTTAAASRFVAGQREQGLQTACTAALTLRRMHAHSNTLIGTMIVGNGYRRSTHLVATMLAELTPDETVPATCREALAEPTLDDVNYAGVAANEWNFIRLADNGWPKKPWHPEYAPAMGVGAVLVLRDEAAARAMLNDGSFDGMHLAAPPDALQRVVHPFAPAAIVETANELTPYLEHGADYVADIRMGRLMLWLHDHPSSAPLASRLASVPDAFGLPLGRAPVVGCEGRCLDMRERADLVRMHDVWPVQPVPSTIAARRPYCPQPRAAASSEAASILPASPLDAR